MYLKATIKSILEKSDLKILTKSSRVQLKENLNFNRLINVPGQVTADEQSRMCYFLGKRSDDPENIDWIPTIFKHKQRSSQSEIIKVDQWRKTYKSICEKRAIISDTSSNSNRNEECRGEKEEVNFDFTIDESFSADKNIQCDLYKNEVEKLQELIAYKAELIERNEEIYKLHEENN